MPWDIYQYVGENGRQPISIWYEALNIEEKAKLDWAIEQLGQNGPDLYQATWCASLGDGIWKLKIRGRRQYRLMLCKGPVEKNRELTLLLESVERDNKLQPADAKGRAIKRMKEVASDPKRRRVPWPRL